MEPEIEEIGADALLNAKLTPDILAMVDTMPGRHRWQGRTLRFELSRANVEHVLARLGAGVSWKNPVRLQEVRAARGAEQQAPVAAGGFVFGTPPRDYQLAALQRARGKTAFGYFLEMGLGKTKVCIDDAAMAYEAGSIDCLLVLAPNGVHTQWLEEQLPQHAPPCVAGWMGCTYAPAQTKAWQARFNAALDHKGFSAFAFNIDSLVSDRALARIEQVLDRRRVFMAIDESVRIKTPGAQRTKQAHRLGKRAVMRRILTGAPITIGIEDLFAQFKFLGEDLLGYSSFYTFRARYCRTAPIPGAPTGAVRIVGYQNVEELQERVAAWVARERAEAVLGLPPRSYVRRPVELTPAQRAAYAALRDEFLLELSSGALVAAPIALTRLLRLQQVICGFVTDETGALHELPSNRVSAAVDAVEEASGKVVVWARFQHDIDALRRALAPWRPVVWDGRTSADDRQAAKRAFLDGDAGVFIGNQAAAGTGLDGLQHASHTMIYFSNSFSANDRWQSEARLHRSGQTGTVNVIDLVTRDTIDDKVLKALQAKKSLADATLDGLRDLLA